MHLLQYLHNDSAASVLDFWGPLVPWTECWSTRVYETGRIIAARPRVFSRGLLAAYERLRPAWQWWQRRASPLAEVPA
jgi:hypothetical protein